MPHAVEVSSLNHWTTRGFPFPHSLSQAEPCFGQQGETDSDTVPSSDLKHLCSHVGTLRPPCDQVQASWLEMSDPKEDSKVTPSGGHP